MIWPFRPREPAPDRKEQHSTTLDLIEQVAALRGQVRALESEWDDMRTQIKKGYQRMEKAFERAEVPEKKVREPEPKQIDIPLEARGFMKKLKEAGVA